jgi:signal transduction histidine kinase
MFIDRNLTIRQKLRLILMTVSTVAVTLACLAFITLSMILWRRSVIQDLRSVAEIVENNCLASLAFDIPEDADSVLSSLRDKKSVVSAIIYLPDGRVFGAHPPERRSAPPAAPSMSEGYEFGRRSLVIRHPILLNRAPVGVLRIENDLGEAYRALGRQVGVTIAALALALGAAYLLSGRLERRVSEPVLSLTATARAVAGGDYNVRATEEGGSDETGVLTRAFNQMLSGISERDAALRKEVTIRRRAEAQLQALNVTLEQRVAQRTSALERSNQDLEQFASMASHDLQEPLRMVGSYVQVLERRYKGKIDAEADKYIKYAVDGALRMQRMINGLLAYSRVTTRGDAFEDVSCEEALKGSLLNLKGAINESTAKVSHDALPSVSGDRIQLEQLFQNLIGNAIKYRSEAPPLIHVSAEKNDSEWTFSVKDNGIGIDPAYHERIFEIFERLHDEKEYPGTGIGLAVCKRIVERHGGRIWVDSQLGQGSTFRFAIPMKRGDEDAQRTDSRHLAG